MALKAYLYLDDLGNSYPMVIDDFYGGQADLGWAAADSLTTVPRTQSPSIRPRCVLVVTAAGHTRRVPCGTPNATAYTTHGAAVNIHLRASAAGTATAAKVYGHEGEKIRNRPSSVSFP